MNFWISEFPVEFLDLERRWFSRLDLTLSRAYRSRGNLVKRGCGSVDDGQDLMLGFAFFMMSFFNLWSYHSSTMWTLFPLQILARCICLEKVTVIMFNMQATQYHYWSYFANKIEHFKEVSRCPAMPSLWKGNYKATLQAGFLVQQRIPTSNHCFIESDASRPIFCISMHVHHDTMHQQMQA